MKIFLIRIFSNGREMSYRVGDRYHQFTIGELELQEDMVVAYSDDGEAIFSVSVHMVMIEYVDTYKPVEHTSNKDYRDDATWEPAKPPKTYNKVREPGEKEQTAKFDAEKPPCPDCGKTLIRRKGKFGEFWGCSTYPNCRYTKNIKSENGGKRASSASQAAATAMSSMSGGFGAFNDHIDSLKSKHLAHHDTEDFGIIDENGYLETLGKMR